MRATNTSAVSVGAAPATGASADCCEQALIAKTTDNNSIFFMIQLAYDRFPIRFTQRGGQMPPQLS
jgi:hypothetical protein